MRVVRIAINRNDIEQYINEHDMVKLNDLCEVFGISISTARRHVEALNKDGKISKMYGCIMPVNKGAHQGMALHSRMSMNPEAKRRTAQVAAQFVQDNDVIFIDSGSTTCLMVEFMSHLKSITIVTNNLDVVVRSIPYPNLEVYVLPGLFNRKNNSFSLMTNDQLYSNYNIEKAFLSSSGVSLIHGVSHTDLNEKVIKQCAIERTAWKFLLLDHSKFGKAAPLHLCDIDRFDTICTDTQPPKEYMDYCSLHKIAIHY